VTYKLAALRFRSVGERSARFQDLPLTFTAPAVGGSERQDSVIWLRNGGGKSSILSLLYALLLPRAADFMGRTVKRSLTDYIDGGDTAHVVAVWEPAGASRTLLGDPEGLLVTGAVHEWADLKRPAQPEASRDRLSSLFYAFHAVPGVLDLATLPFTDPTGHIRRLAEYEAALKEQARPCDRQAGLVATSKQHQWRGALGDRHLDPEVFRSQKQMNHVEGGVEDLFRFATAQEFIDFLLDLTVAPDSVTGIATRLGQVSKQLAAKPAKQDEQNFCTRAATDLDGVASGHAAVEQAVTAANQAGVAAATLAASFQAVITAADAEQAGLLAEEEVARQAVTAANNERNQANDLAYLYRREAARLRLGEAEAALEEAKGVASGATASARAWEVVPSLAGLAGLMADLDRAEKEAAAEEADLAPLRAEHARHAARLRHRLEELATKADAKEQAADTERRAAAQAVSDEKERAEKAREEEREARDAATKAQGRLEELDNRRRRSVQLRHLPDLVTPPAEHRDIVGGIRGGLADRLAQIAEQTEERRTQRTSLREHEKQLITDWNAADQKLSAATSTRQSLGERLEALCDSPRVRELAEAPEEESVILWSESSVILRRLSDSILAADDERVRRRAERHVDERTIAEHDRSQFLPSSLDTDQVRETLATVTAAETGWEYLRGAMPPSELLALLDTPAIARLGSGVVVPTAAADDAVARLEGDGIRTTSLVSVYTAVGADEIVAAARVGDAVEDPPAWTALRRGLVDQDEAAATVRFLKQRAQAAQREDAELAQRHAADQVLHDQIVAFLKDCPAGKLEAIDADIAHWDVKRRGVEQAQDDAQKELKDLDEADRAADKESAETSKSLRKVESTLDWLDDLIPALREEENLRQALSEERERAANAAERASDHAERQVTAAGEAQKQEAAARAAADEAGRYRSEAALLAIGALAVAVVPDPAMPLDALQRNEAATRAALEQRTAQSVLADRVQNLTGQVAKADAEIARHPAELQRHARHLLATPDGQELELRARAIERARNADREAAIKVGTAEEAVRQRSEAVTAIEQLRREPPRRTLPERPATATAADELAARQEANSSGAAERLNAAEIHLDRIGKSKGLAMMDTSNARPETLSFKCSNGAHDGCTHKSGVGGGLNPKRLRLEFGLVLCKCGCHSLCSLAGRDTVSFNDWNESCSCAGAEHERLERAQSSSYSRGPGENARSARARHQRQRDAINSVRSRSAGKSRQQVRDLLVDEFDSRSLGTPPDPVLDIFTDAIVLPDSSLESVRMTPHAARLIRGVGDEVRQIFNIFKNTERLKDPRGRDPYTVTPGHTPAEINVILDAGAEQIIEARSERHRQSAGAHMVPVSLEPASPAQDSHTVMVQVDMQRVGVLSAEDGGALAQDLHKAAQRKQTVMMLGRYGRRSGDAPPYLRIYPGGPFRA
jgi:hypothetical protein